MTPSAASSYYESQRNTSLEFLQLAEGLWGAAPPRDFDSWFGHHVDELVAAAMVGQREIVSGSDAYVAAVLEETGVSVAAEVLAQPAALVGVASDGRPLESLLYGPVITAKGKIADGASPSVAWESGLQSLALRVHTLLADTARAATGLSIAARPRVGYVRMLVGRSCSRCAILAGRFYPYSAGFLRHPQCNCRHIPASEDTVDDLRTDPQSFFEGLGEAERDKVFTKAGAQAIRDGADINQVVNARRGAHGLDVAGSSLLHRGLVRQNVYGRQLHTTTEGVTKRGLAGKAFQARGRNAKTTPRLMPEAIYELAGSREEALQLLRMNGYASDVPGRRRSTAAMPRSVTRVDGVPRRTSPGSGPPPRGPGGKPRSSAGFPDDPIHALDGTELPYRRGELVPVLPKRRTHILDGDEGKPTSGGHRSGVGRHLKTEFPKTWSDEKIIESVQAVLDNAGTDRKIRHDSGVFQIEHIVDRVLVRVVLGNKGGKPFVITAHPLDGDGVIRNYHGVREPRPFGWWDENEKRLAEQRRRRRRR